MTKGVTVKADVLEKARGLSFGPPASMTREEDPAQTQRFSPEELNELLQVRPSKISRRKIFYVGIFTAFLAGIVSGHRPVRPPPLPPPVQYRVQVKTLTAQDLPVPVQQPKERRLLRLNRKKTADIKKPLFATKSEEQQ